MTPTLRALPIIYANIFIPIIAITSQINNALFVAQHNTRSDTAHGFCVHHNLITYSFPLFFYIKFFGSQTYYPCDQSDLRVPHDSLPQSQLRHARMNSGASAEGGRAFDERGRMWGSQLYVWWQRREFRITKSGYAVLGTGF